MSGGRAASAGGARRASNRRWAAGHPAPAGNVSRRRAIAIAIERVGGGRVDGVERGEDDGRAVWEVELARAGGVEHEVSVSVSTGRVVDVETDRDRDDDDND